jgi:hypothetical protein
VTESTSHVEQQVQQRIAAARIRVQAAQERRTSLAEARRRGLARRHARKLLNLRDSEQRQASEPDGQDHDDHRASVRTADGTAEDTPSSANTTEGAAP